MFLDFPCCSWGLGDATHDTLRACSDDMARASADLDNESCAHFSWDAPTDTAPKDVEPAETSHTSPSDNAEPAEDGATFVFTS